MQNKTKRSIWYVLFSTPLIVTTAIWYNNSGAYLSQGIEFLLIALGRLTGLYAQLLILLQILLVARITPLESVFAHDKMNVLHRYVGFSLLGFLIAHPLFLVMGYAALSEVSYSSQFISFVTDWHDVSEAIFGICIFTLIGIISIRSVRNRIKYEAWYLIHLLSYLAILWIFGHQTKTGDMASGGALYFWNMLFFGIGFLFLLYRWAKPIYQSWRNAFVITEVTQENDTVTSVTIGGKNMQSFLFKAGQYANIKFHKKGGGFQFLFPHPFSFSKVYNGNDIRFSIKNSGNYTSEIASLAPGTKVSIDGPLGRFTKDAAVTNKFLLIAGGIGITPIRALSEELARADDDVIILYAARTKSDLVFIDEIKKYNPRITCFTSQEICDEAGFCAGTIDAKAIETLVPDCTSRDVYMCGPAPMMLGLEQILKDKGVPKEQIHFERFGY